MLAVTGIRAAALAGAVALALGGCVDTLSSRPVAAGAGPSGGGGASLVPVGGSEDFVVNVGRRTFFREGSAELDSVARETLDKQAEWLRRFPRWTAKIQGFADDPGSKETNVALSAKRASAVRNYLIDKGIPAARLTTKGYGRDRLVRDCRDLSCTSQNRRVVTNLNGDTDL